MLALQSYDNLFKLMILNCFLKYKMNHMGEFDYMLRINTPDKKHDCDFIINVLGTIGSIVSIQSIFVMNRIKENYALHLYFRY
jgi:DNA-binding Lrp family transcriptional regulator